MLPIKSGGENEFEWCLFSFIIILMWDYMVNTYRNGSKLLGIANQIEFILYIVMYWSIYKWKKIIKRNSSIPDSEEKQSNAQRKNRSATTIQIDKKGF